MARRLPRKPLPLDDTARELARKEYALAAKLAWEQFDLSPGVMPLDELAEEAGFALVYAASRFDPSVGPPFGAYATMVIRHRLIQAVAQYRRRARRDPVRFTDLASGVSENGALPLDPPCPRTREPSWEAASRELLEKVRRCLPPHWFLLLELYFVQGYTLEAAGRQIGISRERARQVVAQGIARARRHCGD